MRRLGALVLGCTLLAVAACGGTEPGPTPQSEPARLFLAGDGELTVVDVDAWRTKVHRVPELAPGDPRYRIVRRGDQLVLFGFDTYVVDLDLRSPPRKLGESWFFIPGAEPDRVWLTELDPASPETERALAAVREVSVDGHLTFPGVRPPGGRWPDAAVGDTLVLEDGKGGLELWNPATGEFTRRLPDAEVGPTQGDLLAWCERDGGILHVTDVESGRDRAVEPPPEFAAFDCWSGAFSPDGTTLAMAARSDAGHDGDRTLTLVDLGEGEATPVAGSTVGDQYVFVAWSASGDRVFTTGTRGDGEQRLVQYRLGDSTAAEIPVRVHPFYGLAAR